MSVTLRELTAASFDKRHFARHYPYSDYAELTTVFGYSEYTALGAALVNIGATPMVEVGNTFYLLGHYAKAKLNPASTPAGMRYGSVNWPTGCYGRELVFECNQDAWISIIQVNPAYLEAYVLSQASAGKIPISAAQGLYEKEWFLAQDDKVKRMPIYAWGIIFRADSVGGTLKVWAEASVEGSES